MDWNGRTREERQLKDYENGQKYAAQSLVSRAIKKGTLVCPKNCTRCGIAKIKTPWGRSNIEAHHPDYTKPLEVEWLCRPCHKAEHRAINNKRKLSQTE